MFLDLHVVLLYGCWLQNYLAIAVFCKGGKCIFEICCVTFGYQQLVLYDPFLLRIEARSGK